MSRLSNDPLGSITPTPKKKINTYLYTTPTPVTNPASGTTQANSRISGPHLALAPALHSNACPGPDMHRACMIPGCTADRVYDEPR